MNAGTLKHRVSIQSQSTSVDAYGEPADTWSTDETVWASVIPVSGNEQMIGQSATGVITHNVTMRYNTSASPKKRLLFGSRILGIESVINVDEANETLKLLCAEESN